ncbi:unnamed protein product [Camellia sinensis]
MKNDGVYARMYKFTEEDGGDLRLCDDLIFSRSCVILYGVIPHCAISIVDHMKKDGVYACIFKFTEEDGGDLILCNDLNFSRSCVIPHCGPYEKRWCLCLYI